MEQQSLPRTSKIRFRGKAGWFGRTAVLSALLLVIAHSGCRREVNREDALAQVNETNIQRLANLYFSYQMKHDWNGPKSEDDFKEFINGISEVKLTRIGIEPGTVDQLFLNPRDGEPFRIRYGVRGSVMGSSAPVVFESVGVDGMRVVGLLNMEQREVAESEYEQLWSGALDDQGTQRSGTL